MTVWHFGAKRIVADQRNIYGPALVRRLLLFCAGALLAGCTVGPQYRSPTVDLSDSYSLLVPVGALSEDQARWWLPFDDPVLNRLIELSLSENLSLAEARQRIKEAAAIARRDGVLYRPGIDTTYRSVLDGGGESLTIGASLGLDLFGQRRRQAEASLARLQAAEFDAENAQLLLLSQLTLAYVDLRFNQESILLRQKDLRSRRQTLRDISTLVERGAATRLDQLRARSLVAETEAQLPRLIAQGARQRNRIATLLGRSPGALGIDIAYMGHQPQPDGKAALGVPADLVRRRPDIRQAERLYAAAIAEIGVAEAARYPSLSLSGQILAPVSGGAETTTLSAGLALPLFEQNALIAQVDASQARASQAYLQWRLAVLLAVEEVENALAAISGSRQGVTASRKVVVINEETLRLSRRLLDTSGEITVLDLLDRERSVSDARGRLAQSLRDYAADYIALNVALGLGISVMGGE